MLLRVRPATVAALLSLAVLPCERSFAASVKPVASFTGMCDASAVVNVPPSHILAANDEDNVLRLYDRSGGPAVREYDFTRFLRLDRKAPESDIEAAAQVGSRVYWMSSHGLNRDGRLRPNRKRFFATDLSGAGAALSVQPWGAPCETLLEQMLLHRPFDGLGLAEASKVKPKDEDGLNIEGIAAGPGNSLLIGFRNPIPEGRALIIRLLNPDEVLQRGPARFGPPLLLDLQGLGIRDMLQANNGYLLVAGPYSSGNHFRLCRWDGVGTDVKTLNVRFGSFRPEAMTFFGPEQSKLLVLSDDGSFKINGKECKSLAQASRRSFRSAEIMLR